MRIGGTEVEPGQIILGKSAQPSSDGGGRESGFQTLPQRPLTAEGSLVPTGGGGGWGTGFWQLYFLFFLFLLFLFVL